MQMDPGPNEIFAQPILHGADGGLPVTTARKV